MHSRVPLPVMAVSCALSTRIISQRALPAGRSCDGTRPKEYGCFSSFIAEPLVGPEVGSVVGSIVGSIVGSVVGPLGSYLVGTLGAPLVGPN